MGSVYGLIHISAVCFLHDHKTWWQIETKELPGHYNQYRHSFTEIIPAHNPPGLHGKDLGRAISSGKVAISHPFALISLFKDSISSIIIINQAQTQDLSDNEWLAKR